MRIFSLAVAGLLLAACSPGGHRAARTETPAAGVSSGAAPVAPVPSSAAPGEAPSRTAPEGRTHRVTFTVGGTVRRTSVTYALPGGPKKRIVVSPPWSKTFTASEGQEFDIRAHSDGGGSLSCSLKVDGEVLKDAMSSGGDMAVDCGDGI